ncbi:MAG: transcription elongation factor GreA [Rhodospirillaceae bacterium]|nr:transcription elongation factor GreA [Rhodospirillaceae bacterium]|tara:strand:- start:2916 stop:3389 length:474 start_codon:yes stop_codon:yes gene_type:complete
MDKAPMTSKGHGDLEAELKRLKTIERPDIIRAIAVAREHGDLSENAEYHAARERQAFVEGRVGIIEDLLSRAEIIDVSAIKGKTIKFGATVKVADEDTDDQSTYQVVGEHEANIKKGLLSVTSPMARAMIGKTVGDSVEVTTPGGTKSYEIITVKYK